MSDEILNLNKKLSGGGCGGWIYRKYMRINGGSSQIRTIAYKERGGLILVIFVGTYYVDDLIVEFEQENVRWIMRWFLGVFTTTSLALNSGLRSTRTHILWFCNLMILWPNYCLAGIWWRGSDVFIASLNRSHIYFWGSKCRQGDLLMTC